MIYLEKILFLFIRSPLPFLFPLIFVGFYFIKKPSRPQLKRIFFWSTFGLIMLFFLSIFFFGSGALSFEREGRSALITRNFGISLIFMINSLPLLLISTPCFLWISASLSKSKIEPLQKSEILLGFFSVISLISILYIFSQNFSNILFYIITVG